MLLTDHSWQTKYTPEDGNLVKRFYLPALSCAVRYDRSSGYFSAYALALAMRGLEGLIRNQGRMRLIVGCTLGEPEVTAIEKGAALRDTIEATLMAMPLAAPETGAETALELLAWLVAEGYLEVRIAVPCDAQRRPVPGLGLFHEKAGIIEDPSGNRLAFSGSLNETAQGWLHNWDSFHVYTTFGGGTAHVDAEEISFQRLWTGQAKRALVMDVPSAVRQRLLQFLPPDDRLPVRLQETDYTPAPTSPPAQPPQTELVDPRRLVWSFIRRAPALPGGGERVGEATAAVTPWPHQIRAFQRLYEHWPPHLLIADEVGLGKTIQAGLLLRQAWLAGRARRILVLAPKAVLRQWQVELREKFNLNWPIYDGQRFGWYRSPGLPGPTERPVGRQDWHKEPCVLASSHLMRRRDRGRELLEDAEPWDLIVLDEAHHARRRGGGTDSGDRPNHLLRLMQGLRHRTQGLVLLTATPMQVSPIEVYDLLALLGLPAGWHAQAFLDFFRCIEHPNPSHADMMFLAELFREVERSYGEVDVEEAQRFVNGSRLKARRLLRALRDHSSIPLKQLETPERAAAMRLMKAHTPVRRLISRHTRELLRRYGGAGKLKAAIAEREVEDRFIVLSEAERRVYEAVEDYISSTYDNAAADERTAVGFVMTIYRRRLASSFHALTRTLEGRLKAVMQQQDLFAGPGEDAEEDILDDEIAEEVMDADEAEQLERETLVLEERSELQRLLAEVRRLPIDTKATVLRQIVRELRDQDYRQVIVFTQYTDTLDFLRRELAESLGVSILCFSGRGGEIGGPDGTWRRLSREDTKRLFHEGRAEIMLCTDAAAEGLNFQFCGALINYDMPWNPMRVEQRIGRIDRLGQVYPRIRIVNLHYEDTVETDVYRALRQRIDLFQTFVGRLQPILARLPRALADITLRSTEDRERARSNLVSTIAEDIAGMEAGGFDLDEMAEHDLEQPQRSKPLYDLDDLGRVLTRPSLLPPGIEAKPLGKKDFAFRQPGMPQAVRVTIDAGFFEEHPESTELWSPGGPLFPWPDADTGEDGVGVEGFAELLELLQK